MPLSVNFSFRDVVDSVMELISPSSRYVFHHIPKCGGTSIFVALVGWFKIIHDYRTATGDIPPRHSLKTMKASDCLTGHFDVEGIYLHQRYPEVLTNKRYKLFTFVRDPLELKISLYYYEKKHCADYRLSLTDCLFSRPNFMAARFPCTMENYRDILGRYFFIGVLERAQSSIDQLAELMQKPCLSLTFENVSQRDGQVAMITPDMVSEFKKINSLDYLIYDYCCERIAISHDKANTA